MAESTGQEAGVVMPVAEQTPDQVRWNKKWAESGCGTTHGSSIIELLAPYVAALASDSTLLDVGGGGSDDSLRFLKQGFHVTVVDVSDVGLEMARGRAEAAGFATKLSTVQADLEVSEATGAPGRIPPGPFLVVANANYLNTAIFEQYFEVLLPGGLFGCVVATTTNLERNAHPSARFCVQPGSLPTLLPHSLQLETLHFSEDWRENGRHEAHLVVRKAAV
eukprot:TRINITY_DN39658_c0_g1_i1.p1 TRINITY_DN39658_c0_g1~~TRINITY_DN39658_c0_g1_i1.p1  ORF type:complete len:221 (-),score=46.06 TRINITY_DN39658_c0_g1_i1:298-960(-)